MNALRRVAGGSATALLALLYFFGDTFFRKIPVTPNLSVKLGLLSLFTAITFTVIVEYISKDDREHVDTVAWVSAVLGAVIVFAYLISINLERSNTPWFVVSWLIGSGVLCAAGAANYKLLEST